MTLLPLFYALLAALTGIQPGASTVEEPRVAATALAERAQSIAVAAAGACALTPKAHAALVRAPALPITIGGAFWRFDNRDMVRAPARRRE